MREIKFRAWDKEDAIMWEPLTLEEFIVGDWELSSTDGVHSLPQKDYLDFSHNKTVWMQCTGLKDKNGVEIYEGDIVRCTWNGIREVVWKGDSGYPSFRTQYRDGSWSGLGRIKRNWQWNWEWHLNSDIAIDQEVIGNIHENPELLSPTSNIETDA